MFPFKASAIILGFFDQNVGFCCSCFSVALVAIQAMTRGEKISEAEKEAELKSYKDHCKQTLLSLAHPQERFES